MITHMEFRFVNPAPRGCQFYLRATNTPDHDVDLYLTDENKYELQIIGNRERFSKSFDDYASAVREAESRATVTVSF